MIKKIILKWKIRRYLHYYKKLQKIENQISKFSGIYLSPGNDNSVQICVGRCDFFKLVKPKHGNVESFAHGGHRYKHTFKHAGVNIFYLSEDEEDYAHRTI